MKTAKKKILTIFCFTTAGIVVGIITTFVYINHKQKSIQTRYNLLAKRILIDNPNQPIVNFSDLSYKINNYKLSNLNGIKSSIYFEYLPTGTAIGIDEDEQMVGASLLKTPVAINLYKLAEYNKINLDDNVTLKQEWLNNQFGELYKKGVGYQISLRDLTRYMLKDSDNTAELAIFDVMKEKMSMRSFYNFIDIDYNINKDDTLQLGTRSYSSILKCLYYACYLNKNNSQELLSYLTETTYDKRLMLYINEKIVVAHKFGTFGDKVQSDCGIFYIPNKNYLLCVMIEGGDTAASRQIGDVSQIVYEYIKNIPVEKQ